MVCFLHKAALACNGMVCTFLSRPPYCPPLWFCSTLSETPTFVYISGHNVVQVIDFCLYRCPPRRNIYLYIYMALKCIRLVTVVRALATSTTAWKSVVLLSSSSYVGC